MIQGPWLMIFLVFISTFQWTCIKAQHPHEYNLNWQEYSFLLKVNYTGTERTNSHFQDTTTPITVDSNKYENRAIITTTNVRTSTTNLTKSQQSNHSTILASKTPQIKSSPIVVLPNSTKKAVHTIPVKKPDQPIIVKCSKNDGYCEHADNYPRRDLQQILRTSKFIPSGLFGEDPTEFIKVPQSTISRPQPMCASLEQIIYPEAAVDKNLEWRYIFQGPNNDTNKYRQGIRVETCINSGEPCKFCEHLPSGYTTICVQKYIYRKLAAIKDSKEMYYDSFRMPSCCACMYTADLDLSSELLPEI
ncbi:protein spaetzle-like isoform X2 [Adelges cooleyi]|uniref:protein spaetzle-like isoform X2 n=1 Tax=Adelges cooleyi TaxID=133065 RepID=UPI0021801E8C|nr:protein spaetzle-like isoform X2 [Adelges cooleyi]